MGLIKKLLWFFGGAKKQSKPKAKYVEFDTSDILRTIPITIKPAQYYIIKHGGEYYIYDSFDQMDEETRKIFENLESSAPFTVYVEGEGRTFSKLEDIPEEIRKTLRRFDSKQTEK